jgi:hypothetical protein
MTPAGATFIIDPNPGGAQFKIDNANKDVNTFTGTVGGTIENPKGRVDAANSAQANLMGLAQSAQIWPKCHLGRFPARSAVRVGSAVAEMIAPLSSRWRAAARAVRSQTRRRRCLRYPPMPRSKSSMRPRICDRTYSANDC